MFKRLTDAFSGGGVNIISGSESEDPFRNLHEAQHLAETFFQSQGNPPEIALVPEDHARLLGFAVLHGRKMEGMPNAAIEGDVAKEIANYAWKLTAASFQACEPPGAGSILYKRPDLEQAYLEQTTDGDLTVGLVPFLSVCVSEGREMERRRIALAATS